MMNSVEKLNSVQKYLSDNAPLLQPMEFKQLPDMLLVTTNQTTWYHSTICAVVDQALKKGLRVEISSETHRLVVYSSK